MSTTYLHERQEHADAHHRHRQPFRRHRPHRFTGRPALPGAPRRRTHVQRRAACGPPPCPAARHAARRQRRTRRARRWPATRRAPADLHAPATRPFPVGRAKGRWWLAGSAARPGRASHRAARGGVHRARRAPCAARRQGCRRPHALAVDRRRPGPASCRRCGRSSPDVPATCSSNRAARAARTPIGRSIVPYPPPK